MHDGGTNSKRAKSSTAFAKITMAEIVGNMLGRQFHVQITMAKLMGNVRCRQFHAQIHDGGVIGNRKKSYVSCATPQGHNPSMGNPVCEPFSSVARFESNTTG